MSSIKLFLLLATCFFLFPALVFGQTKPEQKPEPPRTEPEDVIKFDTSLVQSDVTVFDKNGRFVHGLKPEQFQLKINNTQREISFFEAIRSGSSDQPSETLPGQPNAVSAAKAAAQRRAVIFFVDDLHLAPDSLVRTRKALLEFIEGGIGVAAFQPEINLNGNGLRGDPAFKRRRPVNRDRFFKRLVVGASVNDNVISTSRQRREGE